MAVRNFDFPPQTHLWDALPVVVAALADEGLTTNDAPHPRITSVLVDGVKRVIVPTSRIVPLVAKDPTQSVDDIALAMATA